MSGKTMLCSLCKGRKKCTPLDTEDPVFGRYVTLMRSTGISKHTEQLGICKGCTGRYETMRRKHQNSITTYSIAGLIFSILYFYFTGNVWISLLILAFVFSLSAFSYCPPLKENASE